MPGSLICDGLPGQLVLPVNAEEAAMPQSPYVPNLGNVNIATQLCQGPQSLLPDIGTAPLANQFWWNNQVWQTNLTAPVTAHSWFYPILVSTSTTNTIPYTAAWGTGMVFTPPIPRARETPAIIRAGRRAVMRSIDIYARFRGMDEIRRFIVGSEITYEGTLFNYKVQKTQSILRQTMYPAGHHIPYRLKLVNKAKPNGHMATGCVYIPSLPVIDQLLALSFHIQDERDERKLLETTNWSPRPRDLSRILRGEPVPMDMAA